MKVICAIQESVRNMIHLNNKLKNTSYFVDFDCEDVDFKEKINNVRIEKMMLKRALDEEVNNFHKLINQYFESDGKWYNKLRVSYNMERSILILRIKRPYNIFMKIDGDMVKFLDKVIFDVKVKEDAFIGGLVHKPNLLDITL